jgi:hypothetical protein
MMIRSVLSVLVVAAVAHAALAQVFLQPVPNLPDGTRVWSGALSADGTTYVTSAGNGWRLRNGAWTQNINNLGRAVTPLVHERGAFSNDGSVMLGSALYPDVNGMLVPVITITQNGEWRPIRSVDPWDLGSNRSSSPQYVRADGQWIAYNTRDTFASYAHAARWNGTSFISAELPYTPTNSTVGGLSLGEDGRVWGGVSRDWSVASFQDYGGIGFGVRVHHPQAPGSFVAPPGSPSTILATPDLVSGNGQVVFGTYSVDMNGPHFTFRWAPDTGLVLYATSVIGDVVSTSFDGNLAIIADGQKVFSHSTQTTVTSRQFLTQLGVLSSDWSSVSVRGMTDDGSMLYGNGLYRLPSGQLVSQAWTVTIPAPSAAALLAFTAIASVRRRRR